METICLQCGDVGFDAYVYCVKCVKFAVHRYCLPEIPKTFDEIVRWVCDDCEAASPCSVGQKVVLTTEDGRCIERVISTSTSYSQEKSISQSSQGGDENYGRTGPMLKSVHENLVSGGDAQLADDCCLSGGEPNVNNDLPQKENVPMEHEPQSNTSRQLDGVEEIEVAVDESLKKTRLRRMTEPSFSSSEKENQSLPTTSDQERFHGEHQSDTSSRHSGEEEAEVVADESLQRKRVKKKTEAFSSVSAEEKQRLITTFDQKRFYGKPQSDTSRLSGEEEAETKHEHQSATSWQLDGVEEVVVADESLRSTRVGKRSEVSSSLSEEERQRLPTTSNEKRLDGEHQSDTSRHSEKEEAEVAADKLSKRRKFRENSDISSAIPVKEKQKQTTSNDFPISYEKKVDGAAPSRFSPMCNECQSSNLARIHGIEEATEVVAEGSSQRTKLEAKKHISTSVTRKEKQKRWSTSPDQFRSRQRKRHRDRSFRYPSSRNESRKDRSRSLDNIAQQRYSGPSLKGTPNSRRPVHNTVREREKKHVTEESLVIPTQSNRHEEVSRQPHEARKPMHETVREKHKERVKERSSVTVPEKHKDRVKERSSVIPTTSNVNEEVLRLTNEAGRPMQDTSREKVEEQVKAKSLAIPTHSNIHKDVFRQRHEARKPMHNTVRERYEERAKEESSAIPLHSNVHKEAFLQPHESRKPMHNTLRERYEEREKEESSGIPTRRNGNGEVSRDPIITQPIQVQPVVDPIWRGRFCVVNKKDDTLGDFVAHLSTRACPQVIAEASLLRALLRVVMVPKSTVWPKSFHTMPPCDDNIALYIFPAERRFEKVFDRLVNDMSDQELAMRTITENAELLIFPSTELPMKYWRFQNKYFIWGVFKAKIPTSVDTQENHAKANK